jgi:hypothetical protein
MLLDPFGGEVGCTLSERIISQQVNLNPNQKAATSCWPSILVRILQGVADDSDQPGYERLRYSTGQALSELPASNLEFLTG